MVEQAGSGNSVKIVAIIAVVALLAVAAWYFKGQPKTPAASTTPPPAATVEKDDDIDVKVDLPDSITIKP